MMSQMMKAAVFFVLHALGRFLSEWERMFVGNSTKI